MEITLSWLSSASVQPLLCKLQAAAFCIMYSPCLITSQTQPDGRAAHVCIQDAAS